MEAAIEANSVTQNLTPFARRYGPWALVTGASDGIGAAVADDLAARGLNLMLVARRRARLEALADSIRSRHEVETAIIDLDLSHSTAIDTLIAACSAKSIGLVVLAAGFGTSGAFTKIDPNSDLEMIDVNCRAVVALTHHFARQFVDRGRGGIILFSSLLAFQGVPRATTYAATKAFIQSFAEGLRAELRETGVDVIAAAPGPVLSGFMARADMRTAIGVSPATVARQTVRALGRTGTVRPGFISKVLEASLSPLPRWGRVRILSRVMGGMTSHQSVET